MRSTIIRDEKKDIKRLKLVSLWRLREQTCLRTRKRLGSKIISRQVASIHRTKLRQFSTPVLKLTTSPNALWRSHSPMIQTLWELCLRSACWVSKSLEVLGGEIMVATSLHGKVLLLVRRWHISLKQLLESFVMVPAEQIDPGKGFSLDDMNSVTAVHESDKVRFPSTFQSSLIHCHIASSRPQNFRGIGNVSSFGTLIWVLSWTWWR